MATPDQPTGGRTTAGPTTAGPTASRGLAIAAWALAACATVGVYAATVHFARWERSIAPPPPEPLVFKTRPANGETGVLPVGFIAADLYLPNVGHGISSTTMNTRTVKLFEERTDGTEREVDGHVNTSGAGDSIIFQAANMLASGATYRFVCNGVRDTSGQLVRPYEMRYTTAPDTSLSRYPVAFDHVQMPHTWGTVYTGLTVGPDHRLYAGTFDGRILRYDFLPDGTLSDPPHVISTVLAANKGKPYSEMFGNRLITGIAFDPRSTAANPILWITHGVQLTEGCPDWTCKLSRLSGPHLGTYQDCLDGLPRAWRDHLSFMLAFGPDGGLYFNQGSSSSTGAADRTWGLRPEHLLTAACLRLDVPAIERYVRADGKPLNVKTEDDGHYDPFAPGAPLTLYATGIRSGFDLLWHTNGHLYSCINGGALGGAAPATPDNLADVPRRTDGPYRGGVVPGIDGVTETQHDLFIDIVKGAYYGHPNDTRGEYVLFGGNPDAAADDYQVVHDYPVGTKPDRNFHPAAWDLGISYSCNGLIEYRGGAFGGFLNGKILTTRYSGGKDILVLELDAKGRVTKDVAGIDGFTQFVDPLDLVEDPATGDLYVSEWGGQKLTLLRPKARTHDVSQRVFLNTSDKPPADPNK